MRLFYDSPACIYRYFVLLEIFELRGQGVASIFSRTVRLAARSSLIFDGSLPPASAKSGRPPPPPPTIGASSFTNWPAGAFLTRSGVTPTTIETLPSERDARTTTPLLILLRC